METIPFANISPNKDRFTREGRELPLSDMGQTQGVKYRDTLDLAYKAGLVHIEQELLYFNPQERAAVVKARAYFRDGTVFEAIGDCIPSEKGNVKGPVSAHYPRMAATRAVVRALGLALNIEAVGVEELGDDEVTESSGSGGQQQKQQRSQSRSSGGGGGNYTIPPKNSADAETGYECEQCGDHIRDGKSWTAARSASYSKDKFGGIFCWNCREAMKGAA